MMVSVLDQRLQNLSGNMLYIWVTVNEVKALNILFLFGPLLEYKNYYRFLYCCVIGSLKEKMVFLLVFFIYWYNNSLMIDLSHKLNWKEKVWK